MRATERGAAWVCEIRYAVGKSRMSVGNSTVKSGGSAGNEQKGTIMTGLRERFGRPLRLGIIGGGPDSWIGRMHRGAAELDGGWRPVAGGFSSDGTRSRAAGAGVGLDAAGR